MTDIEGFLTIYGHSDNLLNNKLGYMLTGQNKTSEEKGKQADGCSQTQEQYPDFGAFAN